MTKYRVNNQEVSIKETPQNTVIVRAAKVNEKEPNIITAIVLKAVANFAAMVILAESDNETSGIMVGMTNKIEFINDLRENGFTVEQAK